MTYGQVLLDPEAYEAAFAVANEFTPHGLTTARFEQMLRAAIEAYLAAARKARIP